MNVGVKMKGVSGPNSEECPFRYRTLYDVIENDVTSTKREELEAPLQYRDLPAEKRDSVDKLLFGGLAPEKIPCLQPRVVRLYISSAGTDTEAERNELTTNVYPKLRSYCRDKYGLDFQVADLRLRLSEDSADDIVTSETFLSELCHCQRISMGPNFAVFLGQQTGNSSLPLTVSSSEFEAIQAVLKESGQDVALLDTCYKEDQNVTPTIYRMQSASSITEDTKRCWSDVETELQKMLADGACKCIDMGDIPRESLKLFKASVLDLELNIGLFGLPYETPRVGDDLAFLRHIQEVGEDVGSIIAPQYVDITSASGNASDSPNEHIHAQTQNLTSKPENTSVSKSIVYWTESGIPAKEYRDYIESVGTTFFCTCRELIDKSVQNQDKLVDDSLCREVAQHWNIANDAYTNSTFVDREETLNGLRSYIVSETDQPLVIYGKTGNGKTAVLARAAKDINEAIQNNDVAMRTAIIVRFIGQTPRSTSIQQLLFSLCHQLTYITGKYRHDIPQDYRSLKLYFIDLLQRGEFGGMVVILLDALDQLSECYSGQRLDWLPSRIAQNVKIIITSSTENERLVERLQNKVNSNCLELNDLPTKACESIMKRLMNSCSQNCTYEQWNVIQAALRQCTLPLFVKLTFEQTRKWRSYDEVHVGSLAHALDDCIHRIFQDVEQCHGRTLAARAIGYLTIARHSLSESEMEDILSLDEEVLNYIFDTWCPSVRRIPSIYWVRLRQDIEPYLTAREVDGILVMCWRYQMFAAVATERYASFEDDVKNLHSTIADYYLGTWSGTKLKPFTFPDALKAKLNLSNSEGNACRYVPVQHSVFQSTEISELYNHRKLSQLPYSLAKSQRYDELKSEVLCNYDWMYTKLKATSLEDVLEDFNIYVDRETSIVGDALRMSGSAINVDLDVLGLELSGRLIPHIWKHPFVHRLIRQCDLIAQKRCPVVANCQIYNAPGGPLQYEIDVGESIRCPVDIDMFTSPDGILLTAKPHYSTCLRVWELAQGDLRPDLQLPVGDLYPTRNGKLLNIFIKNRFIKIYKSDSGELHGEVDYGQGTVLDLDVASHYIAFTFEKRAGPYIIDIDKCEILHKFSFHSHAVAISPNENHLVFNSERNILLYEIPFMERKCVAQASDVPHDIIFANGSLKCFVLTKSKLVEAITFDPINRKYDVSGIVSDIDIRQCVLSHTQKYLLVRAGKCLYMVDAAANRVIRNLQHTSNGVYVDPTSNFTGAGFSPNDDMVVASRYTSLGIWDSHTGQPLRILQSSVNQISRLFTSDRVNKAVTLLEDNSFQVWNLDHLDTDILHSNQILPNSVRSLAVSTTGDKIACHDLVVPEVKILNLSDGHVVDVLQHSRNAEDRVLGVVMSPNGQYVISQGQRVEDMDKDASSFWSLLTDDILWNTEDCIKIYHAENTRYVIFNGSSTLVVFVGCTIHNKYDWSGNAYDVAVVDLNSRETQVFRVPSCTEFVCQPCVVSKPNSDHFVGVVQTCKTIQDQNQKERSRWNEVRLLVRDLRKSGEDLLLRPQNILEQVDDDHQFLDVAARPDGTVLVVYGKHVESYVFDESRGIIRPANLEKGCIVYDMEKQQALQHCPSFLHPTSDINGIHISAHFGIIVDRDLKVFDQTNNTQLSQLNMAFAEDSVQLAMDGRYLVALSPSSRELLVIRVCDGVRKCRVFLHGRATCVRVAEDGRTIVVGCQDGRVMVMSLILEFSDPVREYVQNLPSRKPIQCSASDTPTLLERDVTHLSCSTPDLLRLSARIRSASTEGSRKPPNFQTLSMAVSLAQYNSRVRTQACTIQ